MKRNLVFIRASILILSFFLHIFPFTSKAQRSTSIVKGVVHSETNQPLMDASVVVRNSQTNFSSGTKTDSAGVFTISVPAGGPYTFTASSVGYETTTLSGYNLKDGTTFTLDMQMKSSSASLDQVVVVGYGTQKRKDLTGAVASVGSKDIKDLAITRPEQALSGRAAGVQVKLADGKPGSAPQIRVRGIGSISAGVDPLFVVDGFPTDNIQTLNPNDIETMDILKDASATAIYGSRGSNGVVLITTKRGKTGKAVINLDTYYGLQKISKIPKFLNARQQAEYYYNSIRNRNIDLGNNVSGDPATWTLRVPQTPLDVLSGKNTNNTDALDAVLRTAPQKSYNLSVSGGNEGLRYAISGEYLNQEGIILNSDFSRYSLRANIDARLTKRLTLAVNLNPSYTTTNNSIAEGGGAGASNSIIGTATSAQPYYPLYNPDGSYFVSQGLDASTDLYNAVALAKEKIDKTARTRILANVNATYTIFDGLKISAVVGATTLNEKGHAFMPQLPAFLNNAATGSDVAVSSYNWLTEYLATYSKSFGKSSIDALVGYTAQENVTDANALGSNRYPNNQVPYLSAVGNLITSGTATHEEWSIVSQLGRINYNFDDKYLITTSIRRDGSSRFGANNKYAVFPSGAVAWQVSNEKFMQGLPFISQMKLRLSYGKTGNNNIGNYASYANVNYVNYPTGGGAVSGYAPATLANPDLTWETQEQVNGGIDIGLFNGRVNINVDRFVSRNKDLLLNVNLPTSSGFRTALQNIGEVKNTGWEFVLSSVNLNGQLSWSTDFNLSTYKNKVVRLGPTGDPIIVGNASDGYNITRIGQPIGMFYGFIVDGIFKNAAELAAGPIYNKGLADATRVGDIRFKDVSGPGGKPDGVIDNNDMTVTGTPYPDFYYGITNRLAYKGISLSFNIAGSVGNDIYADSYRIYKLNRSRSRTFATEANYWKSEADPGDGKTPRPVDNTTGGIRLTGTRYMDTGEFLRVNNISLGYMLPRSFSQGLGISAVRFYISSTNPITITKNLSFNPDVSNSGDPLSPGHDRNNYPLPKSVLFGLNVSF
ncbi:MAG TPA: TonB-dependent receptor [Chitinophagaceae bacterium]|nr:TonB-dependent receptor [Chitinophagaceae bacterium]